MNSINKIFFLKLLVVFIFLQNTLKVYADIDGPLTLDCISEASCVTSGDHLSITSVLDQINILSWKEGHGGYAVDYNGKIGLMDFVENGIPETGYFRPGIVVQDKFLSLVEAIFHRESPSFHQRLAQKLSEISEYSSDLALAYYAGIYSYTWIFVEFDLKPTPDIDTVASLPGAIYTPLANRRQQTILIHNPIWNELSDDHKVGLIIHEINYSLIVPIFDKLLLTSIDMRLASAKARELTSYLFRFDSYRKGISGFNRIANGLIPYQFTGRKLDLDEAFVSNAGKVILRTGRKVVELETAVESLNPYSLPGNIKWDMKPLNEYSVFSNIYSICNVSRNKIGPSNYVKLISRYLLAGSLVVEFNNSKFSSLEIKEVTELISSKEWTLSPSVSAKTCALDIVNYHRSL